MADVTAIRGRTRTHPKTREDHERQMARLDDPTREMTYVNVCRCRRPVGPFAGYAEAGVGWAVTYADGVLTLRCYACQQPVFCLALGDQERT